MEDSHDFYIRILHDTVKNDVFISFESVESFGDLLVFPSEKYGIFSYFSAGSDQHFIILVGLILRPLIYRVIPNIGEIINSLTGKMKFSY